MNRNKIFLIIFIYLAPHFKFALFWLFDKIPVQINN